MLPVRREKGTGVGRNFNPLKVQDKRWFSFKPFLVKYGYCLFGTFKWQTKMHLARAIDQALVLPPFIGGEINETFVWPSPYLIDIMGFTGTGWAGDNELEEFQAVWNRHPTYCLGVFDGVQQLF